MRCVLLCAWVVSVRLMFTAQNVFLRGQSLVLLPSNPNCRQMDWTGEVADRQVVGRREGGRRRVGDRGERRGSW